MRGREFHAPRQLINMGTAMGMEHGAAKDGYKTEQRGASFPPYLPSYAASQKASSLTSPSRRERPGRIPKHKTKNVFVPRRGQIAGQQGGGGGGRKVAYYEKLE